MPRCFCLISLPAVLIFGWVTEAQAQSSVRALEKEIEQHAAQIKRELIDWRRDIHKHPELGEQETRTAGFVAQNLTELGLEVKSRIASTGIVAILRGDRPGPVVALRAELDALPVKEPEGLPFASKDKGNYLGAESDVMHACGHDAHVAMLMATAKVLAALKDKLPGTVMFIFQPAEEGPSLYPASNEKSWGAKAMIKAGILKDPKPDAIFGLHVVSSLPSGQIGYRPGAVLASADELRIKVIGQPGHAGIPWRAIDPVTTAAQIVLGLQTIVSRRTDLIKSPTVVGVSTIHGGHGWNVIDETVEMTGTIRTYDARLRSGVHRDIYQVAWSIAGSANAKAEVEIIELNDVLVNNQELTARMAPVLGRAANGDTTLIEQIPASDDFAFFLNKIPGIFFTLGIVPRTQDVSQAAPNHSPDFFVDEEALVVGVRALAMLAVNYLSSPN